MVYGLQFPCTLEKDLIDFLISEFLSLDSCIMTFLFLY